MLIKAEIERCKNWS